MPLELLLLVSKVLFPAATAAATAAAAAGCPSCGTAHICPTIGGRDRVTTARSRGRGSSSSSSSSSLTTTAAVAHRRSNNYSSNSSSSVLFSLSKQQKRTLLRESPTQTPLQQQLNGRTAERLSSSSTSSISSSSSNSNKQQEPEQQQQQQQQQQQNGGEDTAATASADDSSSSNSSSNNSSDQVDDKQQEQQQQQQQQQQQEEQQQDQQPISFKSLGLCREVCAAAAAAKWREPTAVQQHVIPLALQQLQRLRGVQTVQHRDIIAVAATGSGKTGAFLLPLLHELLQRSSSSSSSSSSSRSGSGSPFAVLLSPTRELALQVFDWVQALTAAAAASETTAAAAAAAAASLRGCCCALVGGVDFSLQALTLAKKPQVLVCTPGRLIDHLHRTKGFSVKGCRYIVMDEADKLLSPEYAEEISRLIASTPKDKVVLLFSATMTSSVHKLNKACLVKPIKG
ncbi:hypothetical protein ACSSS7_006178 [Eimeria intestinalis]